MYKRKFIQSMPFAISRPWIFNYNNQVISRDSWNDGISGVAHIDECGNFKKEVQIRPAETITIEEANINTEIISNIHTTTFIKSMLNADIEPKVLLADGIIDGFVKHIICVDDQIKENSTIKTIHIDCNSTYTIHKGKRMENLFAGSYGVSITLVWNAALKVWIVQNLY